MKVKLTYQKKTLTDKLKNFWWRIVIVTTKQRLAKRLNLLTLKSFVYKTLNLEMNRNTTFLVEKISVY